MRHLLLATVLLGSAAEPAPTVEPPPLTISVTVQPRHRDLYASKPDSYLCELLLSDTKERTIGSARLIVMTGRPEMMTRTFQDYSVVFSVNIDPETDAYRVETLVLVRRDYKIVAEQHSTIALLPTTPRYIPTAQ